MLDRMGGPARTRLRIEALESRLVPSSGLPDPNDTSNPPGGGDGGGQVSPADTFTITLTKQIAAGNTYTFSGTVSGPGNGGVTVTFGGGLASLQGKTVTTDANGNYSFTIVLKTDGTDSGTAEATVNDSSGNKISNVAAIPVDSQE